MIGWEYRKTDLNQLRRKTDEIDALCEAGQQGWELVAILANNVAYLKREVDEMIAEPIARNHEVKAKYRDHATGDTWSGRTHGNVAQGQTGWGKISRSIGSDLEAKITPKSA